VTNDKFKSNNTQYQDNLIKTKQHIYNLFQLKFTTFEFINLEPNHSHFTLIYDK